MIRTKSVNSESSIYSQLPEKCREAFLKGLKIHELRVKGGSIASIGAQLDPWVLFIITNNQEGEYRHSVFESSRLS
jgi:hypothetical protein